MLAKIKNYLDESKESRELIKKFDKSFSSYLSGNDIGMRFCAYLFDFLGIVFLFIPCQEVCASVKSNASLLFFAFLFFSYSTFFYLDSYLNFREGSKRCCLLQKLSYIPVSRTDLCVVRMTYLFHYKKKVLIPALLAQLTGALLCYHKVSPANFLYCFLCCALLPFLIAAVRLKIR